MYLTTLYEIPQYALTTWAKRLRKREIKHIKTKTPLSKRKRLSGFARGLQMLRYLAPLRAPILASMYLWFRYADDIIDLDREYKGDIQLFLEQKEALINAMNNPKLRNGVLCEETDILLVHAHRLGLLYGFDLATQMQEIFSTMLFDADRSGLLDARHSRFFEYNRPRNPLILTEEEMRGYFAKLDNATVQATLLISGEKGIVVEDVQGLNNATRSHYNARDAYEDSRIKNNNRGNAIINFSDLEISTYGININACLRALSAEEFYALAPVAAWKKQQLVLIQAGLKQFKRDTKGKSIKPLNRLILQAAFICPRKKFLKECKKENRIIPLFN